jgi:pSer/pThr/pTyr-binding forkhead associated (FHA) protein
MPETVAYLKALTPEASTALGGQYLKLMRFPFRVGRECRMLSRGSEPISSRRRPDSIPNNDLYLLESGTIFNVSREHFLIDHREGMFVLVDRGSTCGTLVEGEVIGEGKKGGWRRLQHSDVIIVGSSESRFIFKFVLSENP